jgi:hypothetical protein
VWWQGTFRHKKRQQWTQSPRETRRRSLYSWSDGRGRGAGQPWSRRHRSDITYLVSNLAALCDVAMESLVFQEPNWVKWSTSGFPLHTHFTRKSHIMPTGYVYEDVIMDSRIISATSLYSDVSTAKSRLHRTRIIVNDRLNRSIQPRPQQKQPATHDEDMHNRHDTPAQSTEELAPK